MAPPVETKSAHHGLPRGDQEHPPSEEWQEELMSEEAGASATPSLSKRTTHTEPERRPRTAPASVTWERHCTEDTTPRSSPAQLVLCCDGHQTDGKHKLGGGGPVTWGT